MFPQVFGKYVLERPIAIGGMASVYLATLRGAGGFEKKLVVKQIRTELASDDAFVKRFVEEAKTTVELSHPNIVPVYELGVEQGIYYLAMELCEGVTLADLLRAEGRLSPVHGAYVGIEICRALDYAHRKAGIVHRDVTPRNVLIDEEGAVRLIDFGIAARAHTGNVEVFGSPGHMPPEQIEGKKLGPATDVFAVGALLYEAWSGKPAFRRKTVDESEKALRSPLPPLGTVDEALAPLDEVLRSALALDPADRPANAEDLSRPLRRFTSHDDAGDVARRLGARVRELCERQRAKRAREDERPSAPPPRDSGMGATRTFATRRDANAWPGSKSDDGPSTRVLPEEAGISSTRRRPSRAAKGAWAARALGLLSLTIGLLVVWRLTPPKVESSPAQVESGHAAAHIGTPMTTPGKENDAPGALPSASPSALSLAVPAARPPAASDEGSSSGTPSANASAQPGHLRLLSTPEGSIEVDGRPRGSAPLELSLPPGIHLIRFTCAPTGETLPHTVRVEPGDRLTVAADFTAATPRVSIRR